MFREKENLEFRVVDTTAEKLSTVGVVFNVEDKRVVDDELSRLAAKLVYQLDLGCGPCGGA